MILFDLFEQLKGLSLRKPKSLAQKTLMSSLDLKSF